MQVNSTCISLLFRPVPLSLPFLFHFQNCSNVSAKNLQQQLELLEGDSGNWRARAQEYERTLTCSLEFCNTRDSINEVGWQGWEPTLWKAALNLKHVSLVCTCAPTIGDFFFIPPWPFIYQATSQGSESLSQFQAPKSVCCQCLEKPSTHCCSVLFAFFPPLKPVQQLLAWVDRAQQDRKGDAVPMKSAPTCWDSI